MINSFASTQLSDSGLGVAIVLILAAFVLALAVVTLTAAWKTFVKAGRPGWKALIPLYNSWVFAEIAGRPGWWGLNQLLFLVPIVGWLCSMAAAAVIAVDAAHHFGKSTKFGAVALWLLTPVGYMILAYGDAKYSDEAEQTLSKGFGTPDRE